MLNQDQTQILPKVQGTQNLSQVRIGSAPGPRRPKKQKKKIKFWVKFVIALLVFAGGCYAGFSLMNHWETTTQSNYNDKVHKVESYNQQVNQLSRQEQDLQQQYNELQDQQQQLKEEKSKLTAAKPFFQKLMDELTGKADEEAAEVDNLETKIEKTQKALKEVDEQLEKVKSLKIKANNLQQEAKQDLHRYESEWEGFVYKFKLFINNLTK